MNFLIKLFLCFSILTLQFVTATEIKPKNDKIFTIDENGYLSANFPLTITEYHIPHPIFVRSPPHPVVPGDPLFTINTLGISFTYRAAFKGFIEATFVQINLPLKENVPILMVRVDGVQYADMQYEIEEEANVYSTSFVHSNESGLIFLD